MLKSVVHKDQHKQGLEHIWPDNLMEAGMSFLVVWPLKNPN